VIFKGNDSIEVMRTKNGDVMDEIIYMPKVWYSMTDPVGYIEAYNREIAPVAYEMIFDSTESAVFKALAKLNQEKTTGLCIALWDELCAGRTDELALLEGPEAAWGWLVENGANSIMTDRPAELLSFLRMTGLHD
jgi:glycerophosphoryl diester phosphodiesterase